MHIVIYFNYSQIILFYTNFGKEILIVLNEYDNDGVLDYNRFDGGL